MKMTDLHPHGTYSDIGLDDTSKQKLLAIAKQLGIQDTIKPEKMHITVIYSRKPCPNAMELHGQDMSPHQGYVKKLTNWPPQDGKRCLVAEITCKPIEELHHHMREKYGATHDYPDFAPHVTLSYDAGEQTHVLPTDLDDAAKTLGFTVLSVKPLEPDLQ